MTLVDSGYVERKMTIYSNHKQLNPSLGMISLTFKSFITRDYIVETYFSHSGPNESDAICE